jgi:uncharacterized damage-inducible protein DinB
MKPHFAMMAGYNAWCNERVYEVAALLPDADYRADRGAFFKSVHGTLNHILVADRIWMKRFTGEGEAPNRLDAILFETFDELRAARQAEDERIVASMGNLSEADLAGSIRYRTIVNPVEIEQPLTPALVHFFNHQTHHRGQVHCLLTGFGLKAPSLDLILFQRQTGIGLS